VARFPRRSGGAGRRDAAPSTSSAVAKFAAGGLVALAAVGVGSYFLMRHIGTTEATNNAKEVTRIIGRQIVQPHLTDGIFSGRPASIRQLDLVVKRRVLHEPIVRVKIWTRGGRIVYSDKRALIGSRYQLGEDDIRALETGGVNADVSDLSRPENRFERSEGTLLEVYLGIHAPNGRHLLFESYQRFSSIASSGSSLWRAFAPALIGALLLLALIQVPLASSMARRLRREHAEREALLQRAIDASERERRRIAGDLHDGVVQRLAGTSFSLAAAAQALDAQQDGGTREALESGAEQTRQSVRELRSLLVEIYPPSLRDTGLESALLDLLEGLPERGISGELHIPPGFRLPAETEGLLYRVAQEAVRNAARHAQPQNITVSVSRVDGLAALTVEDDGGGLPAPDDGASSPSGHFGLTMMRDLAAEAGGVLEIGAGAGGGTRVRLEVPAA
jgi:two-component system, NarL family, sensor kinase